MADPFPTYDVMAKRDSPSWNDKTREAIDQRLALEVADDVLSETQLATLALVVKRICPDPEGRPPTTTLAMMVQKIAADEREGFRPASLPPTAECWRRGLDAIEAEAQHRFETPFASLDGGQADEILRAVEQGKTAADGWRDLPAKLFWTWRLLPDLVSTHWAQPSAWSAMGFGGPASPRGYVRLAENRRDPWEAIEQGKDIKGLPRHHEE